MNEYQKLRDRQQQEFNALPLGFAFSDKQFREMMQGWGLDPEKDTDKICSIGYGGFIQKKDTEQLHTTTARHEQHVPSPTGKAKWTREAIDKLLSNEKYTGRVLLRKTISTGVSQIDNNGLMNRYLYIGTHEAIIYDELFQAVQQAKQERAKFSRNKFAMDLSL